MRRNYFKIPTSFFTAIYNKINVNHTPRIISIAQRSVHILSQNPRTATTCLSTTHDLIKPTVNFLLNYSTNGLKQSDFNEDSSELENEDFTGDPCSSADAKTIEDFLQTSCLQQKRLKLEECSVKPTNSLVSHVLSSTRNDWETAFTFFLWAGRQLNYEHSLREYHSMIAILGKFRKFDTAWSLIDEMRKKSLVVPHTIMIMIRKFSSVHDVAKAINAFYALRRFGFEIGVDEFHGLISALCRYKNVRDAEHLLFCNKTVFPLNTKSFNIVLNGWCNVVGDVREGKRIWREMGNRGIKHDAYSYSSMMSCCSKCNNLNMVMRLYDKMKALGIEPDRKAYNAVVHALAKGRLMKEARGVINTMNEKGLSPDTATYNSLIKPLCKSRMFDEAKEVFDEMIEKGLCPSVRTFHAFFRFLRTGDEVFELLRRMHEMRCCPNHDTYAMLIRKFCRWREIENVFKLWAEMSKNGLGPDRSSYIVLIHGLFLNGRLEEAYKYYVEMKGKELVPEPKVDEMVRAWLKGKNDAGLQEIESKDDQFIEERIKKVKPEKKNRRVNDLWRQPELRNVTRDRGFSFWD